MLGLFMFGLSSCKQEEQLTQHTDNERIMSVEEAIEIVTYRTELRPKKEGSPNARATSDDFNTINTFTLNDKNGLAAIHGITYSTQGDTLFSLVYADDYVLPIIAYGNGKLTEEDLNPPLMSWAASQIEVLEYARDNNLSKQEYIDAFIDGNIIDNEPIDDPDPCEGLVSTTIVGPLLTSEWGQGCNYNNNLRNDSCSGTCGHVLAGCVAIAVGQIMNYHEHPSDYDWGLILDDYSFSPTVPQVNEVATLILDIGNAVNMTWGCGSSGAVTCSEVPTAFTTDFNYRRANACTASISNVIRDNIDNDLPLVMRGTSAFPNFQGGHAWVCDGYRFSTFCSDNVVHTLTPFYHMNWGWSGFGNGWYMQSRYDALAGFNFMHSVRVIGSIIP